MELVPIGPTLEDNDRFAGLPECQESLAQVVGFYKVVGFNEPWICYFARENGELVGNAGFKGQPVNGTVEIAYGTFEAHRGNGVGASICRHLVDLAKATDASIRITARTLPEHSHSTRILEKNQFKLTGVVNDPDDGEVWEWEFAGDVM